MLTGWTAKNISDTNAVPTELPISIQDKTDFATFPASAQNVVTLDFFDSTNSITNVRKYKRTCI